MNHIKKSIVRQQKEMRKRSGVKEGALSALQSREMSCNDRNKQ